MSDTTRTAAPPVVWRTTTALTAGTAVGVILLGLGLLARRADVALLGLPALLSATWGWTHRPAAPVTATVTIDPDAPAGTLGARLRLDGPPGAQLARFRVATTGDLTAERVVDLAPGHRELAVRTASSRTGPQESYRVDHVAYGPEGVEELVVATTTGPRLLVLPRPVPLGRVPLSSRLRGLAGPHTSRRPGDGSELRDVAAITPGDAARRVDWRTTARRSPALDTLYVRRTFGTAEATVVLVLDSRDEVGPDLTTWGGVGRQRRDEPTSLDLARHAAASVARAVLDAGDRVALDDLGQLRRPVRPGGGRRHLRRILHGLALARPVGDPSARLRAPQVPAGSAVYLFSTLLDDEGSRLARQWHDAGHVVVVVDTLPPVHLVDATRRVDLAWRITRRERDDRVARLRAAGVDVVRWAEPAALRATSPTGGSPATALELAARRHDQRRSRAPRPAHGGHR
ncbi:DUF58 domain-containing protein [Cellulosimicrobium marinum]|uniref:DUF58 domain-containing protein n=1 Tax=Cellulosimicrobium marinum TaxID=1638992 RepID=UPI001E3681D2|nr:DUF58 domain-containing protein [Cellulosimicrobium marinum]MCB7137503.1 DUF58 domain-containing protein [Cellulosimicrobium marinum]